MVLCRCVWVESRGDILWSPCPDVLGKLWFAMNWKRGEHVQLDSPFSVSTRLKIMQAIEVHNLLGECFKNINLKVSWTLKAGGEEIVWKWDCNETQHQLPWRWHQKLLCKILWLKVNVNKCWIMKSSCYNRSIVNFRHYRCVFVGFDFEVWHLS